MTEPRRLPEPSDDTDRHFLESIEKIGWAVVGIEKDEEGPSCAFSLGLYHSFGHPEVIIFGLPVPLMHAMINLAGEAIREGKTFEDWHEDDGLLEGYKVCFRTFPQSQYRAYLGYARWLYQGDEFTVLQCVWPDKLHHYPWHRDASEAFQEQQPLICEKDDWPFDVGKNTAAFAVRGVFSEGKPILLVSHEADGSWQFLTGEEVDVSDAMIVGLGTVFEHDSTIGEVADLPEGYVAKREEVGGAWARQQSERDEPNA